MPLDSSVECDYLVLVSRSVERLSVGLWPVKLRESPPKIPIPLEPQDADAVVDLQQLLHDTYDAAGYADYIYTGRPRPALQPGEAEWAERIVRT